MHYMTSYLDSPRMQSVPLPESIRQDKSKGKLKSKNKAPQKHSSIHPETLDDRRDRMMPTLTEWYVKLYSGRIYITNSYQTNQVKRYLIELYELNKNMLLLKYLELWSLSYY